VFTLTGIKPVLIVRIVKQETLKYVNRNRSHYHLVEFGLTASQIVGSTP